MSKHMPKTPFDSMGATWSTLILGGMLGLNSGIYALMDPIKALLVNAGVKAFKQRLIYTAMTLPFLTVTTAIGMSAVYLTSKAVIDIRNKISKTQPKDYEAGGCSSNLWQWSKYNERNDTYNIEYPRNYRNNIPQGFVDRYRYFNDFGSTFRMITMWTGGIASTLAAPIAWYGVIVGLRPLVGNTAAITMSFFGLGEAAAAATIAVGAVAGASAGELIFKLPNALYHCFKEALCGSRCFAPEAMAVGDTTPLMAAASAPPMNPQDKAPVQAVCE